MNINPFDQMTAAVSNLSVIRDVGRVVGISGPTVRVGGLSGKARIGDGIRIVLPSAERVGEVVGLDGDLIHILVDGSTEGITIGCRAMVVPPPYFAPDDSWIGRVIDPDGRAMDGRSILPGTVPRSLRANPPPAHQRRGLGARLETGLAALNTLLPIVRGQRIGLFAGSGVGKSTLIADLAKGVGADIIVIALVGERGREVRHFTDEVLGLNGMCRSIVVVATSDQPPQVRRRCAWSAMAIAEHFRDQGKQVLLLLDSVTRFCEAHRELSVAGGENANLRGYPASTGPTIASLCERAGPGTNGTGDITAVFSVLVAGSDMEEPVADMMRGILDGHIVLDREIAERGRFPAINLLQSVSRSLPAAATKTENTLISQARQTFGTYERAALMVQSGLYAPGSDAEIDKAVACMPALEGFMSLNDTRGTPAHFAKLRQALQSASAATKAR